MISGLDCTGFPGHPLTAWVFSCQGTAKVESLDATKRFLGSHSGADWTTCFYQYTNRLAHLYLLRELNGLPAYLLFLYFINDTEMNGPHSQSEWEGAIKLLEAFLGIRQQHGLSKYVFHVFLDVAELESPAA
jgi:hypothetical protein